MAKLGDDVYYPAGAEKVLANRLISECSTLIQLLITRMCYFRATLGGTVQIVFATTALGMGVHMTDVTTIVHYGAPSSIDDYFQSSGRGG